MFYNKSITALRKEIGVSYLGGITHSAKMKYSYRNGTNTYCVYLAPANMSGHEVCPNSKHCRAFCLNGAGRNKGDILSHGIEQSIINKSRIKKTRCFFENKDLFMNLLVKEIKQEREKAKMMGKEFSVRLNGTSDISPEDFILDGKNILEIFPDVQFYDYTKNYGRFNLLKKYPNYDLTFSYNGYNWETCKKVLNNKGKVAVVFLSDKMPKTFDGYEVEDGNEYDMRYLNSPSSVIYLHYHKTANDYVYDEKTNKKIFVEPNTPFIIKNNDYRIKF